jgi:hypothetical protein
MATVAATLRVAVDWKGIGAVTLLDAGVTRDRRGLVRVPYRYPDGTTAKTKVFARNGRTWWSPIGVDSIRLGLESLAVGDERENRTLIIAEGESDTLAIRDALALDHDGQPIDVIGLPGASTWRDDWKQYVVGHARAYVVGDGDEAGRRMMNAVLGSVSWVRPVLLTHGLDARELLQRDGGAALDQYLDDADETAILSALMQAAPTLTRFHELAEALR